MIIRLTGGLGNQMFQYAYGRSKSFYGTTRFKYFFIHYEGDTDRTYKLGIFYINGKKINSFLPGFLVKVSNLFNIKIPGIEFGYWQSEKYFKAHKDLIRKEFTFKKRPSDKNLDILRKIKSVNSISLHVRRRDYLTNEKTWKYHGMPKISYYNKAVEIIKKHVKKPTFFIFSDDIDWCKKNLGNMSNIIFVEGNTGLKDYEDMRLMSNCKHNIIANSSFSWWGAWLNSNPDKIVIAPKRWFKNKRAEDEIGKEIVPKTWIKI